jgi:Flp pilus assembly protein TadD
MSQSARSGRAGTLIAVLVIGIAGISMLFYAKNVVQRSSRPRAPHANPAAQGEPTTARGWYDRADDLLKRAKDVPGASVAYRKAAGLAPEMGEAHFGLGYTLLELGDVDGAIAELESALSLAREGAAWKKDAENTLVLAHLRKKGSQAR